MRQQPPGHFGIFGGRYVAETLMPALIELEAAWAEARADPGFRAEFEALLRDYVGRPSPLTRARRLEAALGGPRLYLKRDELNHTGAHKINNTLGQVLLARRMGKKRIIAETGAGQHGVSVATAAALFDLPCTIFMGARDAERQRPNIARMQLLGAEIETVESGSRTLKDAMNAALRDWTARVADTHYVIGSVAGPHPYPAMVRELQSVIGREAREQILEAEGRLPDLLLACAGGGSNAMGLFHAFLDDPGVEMVAVEGGGAGLDSGRHAAAIAGGEPGVLHGARSYLLQDSDGQIREAHSISAGLDYPGIGPEHAWLHETGRVAYGSADDQAALAAFETLARTEGILPALEPAHALAELIRRAPEMSFDQLVIVNLCGRGDKDIDTVTAALAAQGRAVGKPGDGGLEGGGTEDGGTEDGGARS